MQNLKRHNFVAFPYCPAKREDGDHNNGGIDLIRQPERIDEIHEASGYAWFRRFLTAVNASDGMFMTFGCAIGILDEILCGYIDFSLRPDAAIDLRDRLLKFDEMFIEYLTQAMPDEENLHKAIPYAKQVFEWKIYPLEIQGQTYSKLNVTFHARQEEGVRWAIEHLEYFLTVHFPTAYRL